MNRCLTAGAARLLTSLTLLVAVATFGLPAQAQTEQREFPKRALRATLVVTSPPQIMLNGNAERLSPGARIRGPNNTLILSGSLIGQEVLVNYVRDSQGLIHEVWVLSESEAREKRAGMSTTNITSGNEADRPKTDDGKTPFNQLPKYPAQ